MTSSSAPRRLIIDCDPGVDDAVAILLAFGSPELEVLAITTVGGNVGAAITARNGLVIRQIAGRTATPVHAGCERPLSATPVEAGEFHGANGLGDIDFLHGAEPQGAIDPEPSADAIVRHVMANPPGSVAVAVLGPMTNLAIAMRNEPALAERLGPVVIMGGARSEGGNITASAEYNIYADPHAADEVFRSGCRTVVFGLDATHQVRATPERMARLRASPTPASNMATALLDFSTQVERQLAFQDWAPLHDPCPVAWLIRPDLFELRPCELKVETGSALTRGHTQVEFRLKDPASATCQWAVKADADGLFALVADRLNRL